MEADSPQALNALPMGTVLNERFTLTDIINTGGFSIIYRAEDRLTGESVALKECAPEGLVYRREDGSIEPLDARAESTFRTALEGMEQEVEALRSLTAAGVAGIPQYIDAFTSHGTLCLAMSEVRGANLHCWAESYRMAGKAFPPSLVESLLTGVLEILENVHAHGYYHCDIKPANIIIDENGGIYLIDFGAVRTATRQHQAVQVSPGFTPVELYPGYRASIGPWSDIYMLATLFYNIITGRVPEPANERAQSDRTPRLSTDARLNKLYSAPLLNSIDKAMSVDEAERYPSARIWLQAYTRRQNGPQLVKSRKRETSAYAAAALDLSRVMRGHRRAPAPTIKASAAARQAAAATRRSGSSLSSAALSAGRAHAAVRPLGAAPQRPAGHPLLRPTARPRTAGGSPHLAVPGSSPHRAAEPEPTFAASPDPALASAPLPEDPSAAWSASAAAAPGSPAGPPTAAAPAACASASAADSDAVNSASGHAEDSPAAPVAGSAGGAAEPAVASAAPSPAATDAAGESPETPTADPGAKSRAAAAPARKALGSRPAAVGLSSPSGEGSSNLPYIMAVIAGLIAVIIYLFI